MGEEPGQPVTSAAPILLSVDFRKHVGLLIPHPLAYRPLSAALALQTGLWLAGLRMHLPET